MHVVAVGVGETGQHMAYHEAFEPALDGLDLFHTAHFEADARERFGYLLRVEVEVHIFFKPFI